MTGVFCNSALKAAEQDHENRLDNRQEQVDLMDMK